MFWLLNCLAFFCLIKILVFCLQTVAVIPILPHGVVQLGSSLAVSLLFLFFTLEIHKT